MSGIPLIANKSGNGPRIRASENKVAEILEFLISTHLIKATDEGKYVTGEGKIHLEKDSKMILRHMTLL
ncbi:MAG: hypothetical protein Q7U04_09160 [Bacteriovorax sp.]|nr:hypothetical protein [Bacteriovorax sp.]